MPKNSKAVTVWQTPKKGHVTPVSPLQSHQISLVYLLIMRTINKCMRYWVLSIVLAYLVIWPRFWGTAQPTWRQNDDSLSFPPLSLSQSSLNGPFNSPLNLMTKSAQKKSKILSFPFVSRPFPLSFMYMEQLGFKSFSDHWCAHPTDDRKKLSGNPTQINNSLNYIYWTFFLKYNIYYLKWAESAILQSQPIRLSHECDNK